MPRKVMWVEWDDDAELSRSQKKPGAYSPLTRDSDKKLGNVTLNEVDEYGEYEEDFGNDWTPDIDAPPTAEPWLTPEEISALAETITSVFTAAKPHVAKWWKNQALPTMKSTNESARSRFARTRKNRPPTPAAEAVTSVEVALEDEHLSMTIDEAQQRLLAALVARAFSDEQVELLMRARIENAGGPLGFKSLMERFTPQEVEGHVSSLLEANPALLDEFVSLFRGERIAGSASLPPEGRGSKWRKGRREVGSNVWPAAHESDGLKFRGKAASTS